MLHITDGGSVAGTLRQSGLPGVVAIFGDLMYEGPCPANLTPAAWIETRAAFLASAGYASLDEARRYVSSFDDTLASISGHDETLLWFDHRLSDQLMLLKLLDWVHHHRPANTVLSLVPVPTGESFKGFGYLSADQLGKLAETKIPVTGEQLQAAIEAWAAFTSPDPVAIERILAIGSTILPFLGAAFQRHLEEFPSIDGGLSRTERQALSALREQGPLHARQLFSAVQRMEDPVFMGDLSFLRILLVLASASTPLINTANPVQPGPFNLREYTAVFDAISPVSLNDAGVRVLQGTADHIALNGIDRWVGGVHLSGSQPDWRWDRSTNRLVHLKY